jgi:hypothetical protein
VPAERPNRDEGEPGLVRPYTEPEGPLERIFDSERNPKGWGRATIKLRTHPLHPVPRVTQDDLLLPSRPDPLTLAGDCFVIGVVFALLVYFPLLLVALAVTVDLRPWILGAMGLAGLAAALYVFFRARSPDTSDLDRFLLGGIGGTV